MIATGGIEKKREKKREKYSMGRRRRASKAPPKKKAAPLPTSFNCPYCNTDKSIGITMYSFSSSKV
jgi:hypothetical protein